MSKEIQQGNKNNIIKLSDLIKKDTGKGFENITAEDQAIPFIRIGQAMSEVITHQLIDNCKMGDIYNNVTMECFTGSEGINVIPVKYEHVYIHWEKKDAGDKKAPKAVYKNGDPNIPEYERNEKDNVDYLTDGSGDYLARAFQWYVKYQTKENRWNDALISFQSTQLKKSKKWLSMCISRGGPLFSNIYNLKTTSETSSSYKFFGWEPSFVRQLNDDEINLYQDCKKFNELISKGEIKVSHEEESMADNSSNLSKKSNKETSSNKNTDDSLPF